MRVCALLWPFPFLVRLGWATAWARNPPLEQARGRVFLLRGNAVVFSRGFGALCRRFRQAGLWADDLRCVGDLWVRRRLRRDHRAGRLHGPLALVGHSCGGRYSLWTAQQLERLGIAVDLLVCVDVAGPYTVPGNVRHAVHLYRSRRRLYPARPLRPAPGSGAVIENIDLDAPDSPIRARWLHHLNITARLAVQDWIFERVLRAVENAPLPSFSPAPLSYNLCG
jgi:hypothetical protein